MAKDERLYGRFTLDFADSPKIMPLSDAAFRALVEMTLYSRRMLTDGFIASAIANARWGASVCFELLQNDPVKPSLIEVENGYLIHDFAEHQTTRAEIESLREKRKAAGRKGGKASGQARAKQVVEQKRSKTNPETETETVIKDTDDRPSKTASEDPEGFAEWWATYPKKADKGHGRRAYAKALAKVSAAELLAGAERYRDDPRRKPDFTKNPATWLNGECWADESASAPAQRQSPQYEF